VSGVVVNLPLGTASGLTGGIAFIQNVIGSAGNDILVGNGDNVLNGGAGRDLLIAGALASTLNGGEDEDILIAGTTDYDSNNVALEAILAEWTRAGADYATRVANLENGTNGVPISEKDITVHSNGRGNQLTGNAGLDFFFTMDDLDALDRDRLIEELVRLKGVR
jgi:Ca2+-binding RTX toxin-like protein